MTHHAFAFPSPHHQSLTSTTTNRAPRRLLTSTATPRLRDVGAQHTHSSHTHTLSETAFSNYGLLITLDQATNELCLEFCPDHNLPEIHPNSYAPKAMADVHKLGGGGSGVAVFAGHHPELGDVVLKHGGDKDWTELFALQTVAQELQVRSKAEENCNAAKHIQNCIPAFRMLYISPHHLGEKRLTLWQRLREWNRTNRNYDNILLPISEQDSDDSNHNNHTTDSPTSWQSFPDHAEEQKPHFFVEEEEEEDGDQAEESFRRLKSCAILQDQANTHQQAEKKLPAGMEISKSGTVSGHRDIAIVASPGTTCQVKLENDTLMVMIPEGHYEKEQDDTKCTTPHEKHNFRIRIQGDGYLQLQAIYDDLLGLMRSHRWKFTLGQKRIGGDHPKTGNEWLYRNQLQGPLLDNLVTQKIQLVRDLVRLTKVEEQDPIVLQTIREEVRRMQSTQIDPTNNKKSAVVQVEANQLSALADDFVGSAIRKNFQAETGRIPVLLMLGKHFREHSQQQRKSFLHHPGKFRRRASNNNNNNNKGVSNLILTPEEEDPAFHLGLLTQPGAFVGSTFENNPMEPTVLETMDSHFWQTLLAAAVQSPHDTHMVWKRLWTCGLADAGLHNLFCSKSRLWLFDLGEPQLTSVPGFLTKFLFSFFHTLGMQEPESSSGGAWVRRFDANHRNNKLRLTGETTRLLKQAYGAFSVALDRIVEELFNADDSVRWLLLQYVTLQLISDASFCVQKWTIKGGGRERGSNHQEGLEKWLWRALWDIYVACDINSGVSLKQLKVQPVHTDMKMRASQTLRERHMALIKELALEAPQAESPRVKGFHRGARGFRPFVNANG